MDIHIGSIFDQVDDVLLALQKIRSGTYEGEILMYMYKINLVEGKPVRGHTNAISQIDLHLNIAGIDLGSGRSIFETEPIPLVYKSLGLDWTKLGASVRNLRKAGLIIVMSRKNKVKTAYVGMPWTLVVQIYHALNTGQIIPFRDINYFK